MKRFSKLESILNGVLVIISVVDIVLELYTTVRREKNESK